MAERIDVMISSTARDLPDHRKEAMSACSRMGMFADAMENLTGTDADAIDVSLDMVNRAKIYVGIFAHRYGYIPKDPRNPTEISITEMEYNRAVERGIPRLIYIMHEDHPLKASDVETGVGAEKLQKFKDRIGKERVAGFFKSPADLRALMIQSLAETDLRNERRDLTNLHSTVAGDVPTAPEPYIAHPYTLLQTNQLAGRQQELNLLTDWVAKPSSAVYQARILNVVAIGGMGKSALTWKWFNDIAPLEMKPLAGRMWWSFYESDARFENFVTRALAYVSGRPREEIEEIPPPEREERLLNILNKEPFLIVLDGLERILIAYARMDAAYLRDDDLDERTANRVAGALGLPESAAQSFVGQHQLRKTADPRAGNFLRKLAMVKAARILVSTRLYPADLQLETGYPRPGSFPAFLDGLQDNDALDLWRAMGVSGTRDELLRLFHTFDNYPLLIRALAGLVANYRRAPGDFDKWQAANPDFNPFQNAQTAQIQAHVLEFALAGLDDNARKVLHTIAAFRMPASYDTLAAMLIGNDKSFADESQLDAVLADLEDRGLLGWDKIANRYDLHPIVRGVTWNGLDERGKHGVYETLHTHLEAMPDPFSDWQQVNSLEDLAPAIELYNTLIGLGRYKDAYIVFRDRLNKATLYRLSASRQRVDLLEMLFPDGVDQLPHLSDVAKKAFTLNVLAQGYQYSGQPGRAVPLFRRHNEIQENLKNEDNLRIGLSNLSDALQLSGALWESESSACRALIIVTTGRFDRFDKAVTLRIISLTLIVRGLKESLYPLKRAIYIMEHEKFPRPQWTGYIQNTYASYLLWLKDYDNAQSIAKSALMLSEQPYRYEPGYICALRLQGGAALGMSDLDRADELLHHALMRARAVNFVEEELPALVALAELHRRRGEPEKARERLDEIWEAAERGPYPLLHADGLNVLAQIERDAGNTEAAIKAATQAYELAWCDGISEDGEHCYAYWWGLKAAEKHLVELNAPIPVLKPFDPTEHEPLPDIDWDAILNPPDEDEDDSDE